VTKLSGVQIDNVAVEEYYIEELGIRVSVCKVQSLLRSVEGVHSSTSILIMS
jgi:hypothetical protein